MQLYVKAPINQVFLALNTTTTAPVAVFMGYNATFLGALTGAALAAAVKIFKHYYIKELRNRELQRENTEAQLRLLMASIHPHFLFNTLNNIYSHAQEESPQGARMLLDLSHILRYVLDEGKKELVPLENELRMLKDYIYLEKMRYGNNLDLHVALPGNTENMYIAPLLLLPFVENGFRHSGAMNDHLWINLRIELDQVTLKMKLMNGKYERDDEAPLQQDTGIDNVKTRLDMLYKNRHRLEIIADQDVYVINLTIDLETAPAPE